jgi:hypothetical protein
MATAELVQVRLTSTPMIHTPGILRWAINGYKFKKDRKALRKVFTDGYNLTDKAADDLLSERIPHAIEGDAVTFEYEAGKYLKS